ncbi:hypothetical protein ThidrDRAFT_1004 [Thiorhodococcus drewsii AZ1]|uniref:Uncharacterized protein n=1 Tax=Thiorhodococcus drewsii AZ1 TaxID=765913 RepID=G2DY92_9GAMM|nr:hypothetical protein [Thiorhodococcus drewsii]EGV32884.1 hypothetical protein ThidrDRAFT_1004 [Thiorhodococcus drewsii AZ1]
MTISRLVLVIAVATVSAAALADEESGRPRCVQGVAGATQPTVTGAMPAGVAKSIHEFGD